MKNLLIILLIIFTSLNVFSQASKFKRLKGKFGMDGGISFLTDKEMGSIQIIKSGISYMVVNKSRRGYVDKIYGGVDMSYNIIFISGEVNTSVTGNLYSGIRISKNTIACLGVSVELINNPYLSTEKINPGLHASVSYFLGEKYSVALDLNYYGKSTYGMEAYGEEAYGQFNYSLVPTLKLRAPLSDILKTLNIDLLDLL